MILRRIRWQACIPYLYDWFSNDNRAWPSLSVRWGSVVERQQHKIKQRAYFAEQTDGSTPNTLIVATCQVLAPRVAAADHICTFSEETRSPFVTPYKTLIHPGEVNKIRELPAHPSLVATHTDAPEVLLWNIETQPNRKMDAGRAGVEVEHSVPDLTLTGHTDNAPFALASCFGQDHKFASGGTDKLVLLWDVADHQSTLCARAVKAEGDERPVASVEAAKQPPALGARAVFHGHTADVEDVCFCPDNSRLVASVGDDRLLALWDERAPASMTASAASAHDDDVHVVDWSPHDANMLVTGSADCKCKVWDRRAMGKGCVGVYEFHERAILRVQWHPDAPGIFTSGGEDARVLLWDTKKGGTPPSAGEGGEGAAAGVPDALIFQHNGHRSSVVDFQWNPFLPWTCLSVSTDDEMGGGSTMQMWRVSDLVYRPKEDCLAEIEGFRKQVDEELQTMAV
jgi:histone-binding protein RBBP4